MSGMGLRRRMRSAPIWVLTISFFLAIAGCDTVGGGSDSSSGSSCKESGSDQSGDNAGKGSDNVVIDGTTYTEGKDGAADVEAPDGSIIVFCDPSVSLAWDGNETYLTFVKGWAADNGNGDPDIFLEFTFDDKATGTYTLTGDTMRSVEYGTIDEGYCTGTQATDGGDGDATLTISAYGAEGEDVTGELTIVSFDTSQSNCPTLPTDPIEFTATRTVP